MENYVPGPIRGDPVAPSYDTKLSRSHTESSASSDQSPCMALISALFDKNTSCLRVIIAPNPGYAFDNFALKQRDIRLYSYPKWIEEKEVKTG